MGMYAEIMIKCFHCDSVNYIQTKIPKELRLQKLYVGSRLCDEEEEFANSVLKLKQTCDDCNTPIAISLYEGCIMGPVSDLESEYAEKNFGAVEFIKKVTPSERIKELAPFANLNQIESLRYTWNNGYEHLEYKNKNSSGVFLYSGAYHPDGYCVGSVCKYCGKSNYD